MTQAHADRAHAVLGASSAHRWMACPGSVRLAADAPRRSSRYADEGTAAHQLAERCLRENAPVVTPAAFYIGQDEYVGSDPWEVTEDMAEAVQVFLDTVRGAMQPGDELLTEVRFDLSAIYPGMFGTNDACVLSRSRGKLYVLDYKHGKGYVVEAAGNPQLRYYGLGALLKLGSEGIHTVSLTIVQPRAPHRLGPVRTEEISTLDLLEWAADLKAAAIRTADPAAPLVAGEHCTFCAAAGACPALAKKASDAAMVEFGPYGTKVPTEPKVLPIEKIVQILDAADMIDDWIAAVRAHALHLADRGEGVPGYKLVPKRATRKWRDADEPWKVSNALADEGVDRNLLWAEPKLKTPAQIEKLLPKDKRGALDALTVKESSGVNLVKDSDPRPEKEASAVADFSAFV